MFFTLVLSVLLFMVGVYLGLAVIPDPEVPAGSNPGTFMLMATELVTGTTGVIFYGLIFGACGCGIGLMLDLKYTSKAIPKISDAMARLPPALQVAGLIGLGWLLHELF